MQVGMIGVGRMGGNMVRRLLKGGHDCVVYDLDPRAVAALVNEGATGSETLEEFMARLNLPRVLWLMLPAALVDATISAVSPHLRENDIVIDGGNSYYRDDIRRAGELQEKGVHYVDVGTSGGVWGLEGVLPDGRRGKGGGGTARADIRRIVAGYRRSAVHPRP